MTLGVVNVGDWGQRFRGLTTANAVKACPYPVDAVTLNGDAAYAPADRTDPSWIDTSWGKPDGTGWFGYLYLRSPAITPSARLVAAVGDNDSQATAVRTAYKNKFSLQVLADGSLVRAVTLADPGDAGNAVQMIALDSTKPAGGDQKAWLSGILKASSPRWRIVAMQSPPYTCSTSGGASGARTHWVPLFAQYNVDFVFGGDHHVYERFAALNGVRYYCNGMGGGPMHSSSTASCPVEPARQSYRPQSPSRPYGYVHLSLDRDSATVRYLASGDTDGGDAIARNTVIDTVTVTKGSAPPPPPPPPPSGSVLWGSHFSGRDGRGNQQETEFMEAKLGRKVSMHRIFMQWQHAVPFPLADWSWSGGRNIWVSLRALDNGSAVPYTSVTNGAHDAKLNGLRNWLTGLLNARPSGTIHFTFEHEPEDNSANGTPTQFRAAWRYVYDRMKVDSRIKMYLVMAGTNWGNSTTMSNFWPGDAYVDGCGDDAYNWYPGRAGSEWRPISVPMEKMFTYAAAHGGKPCGLGEWGCQEDPAVPGRKAQWIADSHAYFKTKPQLTAVCYFHSPTIYPWWMDTSSSSLNAMKTAGEDAHFGGSTAPPPDPVTGYPRIGLYWAAGTNNQQRFDYLNHVSARSTERMFYQWGQTVASQSRMANALAAGRDPIVSLSPHTPAVSGGPTARWGTIVAGTHDVYLDQFAADLEALVQQWRPTWPNLRIRFSLHHEPENDVDTSTVQKSGTTIEYRQMQRRTTLRWDGIAPNVEFGFVGTEWLYIGQDPHAFWADSVYDVGGANGYTPHPTRSRYARYVGVDAYNWAMGGARGVAAGTEKWAQFEHLMIRPSTGKGAVQFARDNKGTLARMPVVVAELGASEAAPVGNTYEQWWDGTSGYRTDGSYYSGVTVATANQLPRAQWRARWITDFLSSVKTFPEIEAVTYFDQYGVIDHRLSSTPQNPQSAAVPTTEQNPETIAAWRAAATDAYFNSEPSAPDPVYDPDPGGVEVPSTTRPVRVSAGAALGAPRPVYVSTGSAWSGPHPVKVSDGVGWEAPDSDAATYPPAYQPTY